MEKTRTLQEVVTGSAHFRLHAARRTRIADANRCVGWRFCFRGAVVNPDRYPHSIMRSEVDACGRFAGSRGFPSQNANHPHADFQSLQTPLTRRAITSRALLFRHFAESREVRGSPRKLETPFAGPILVQLGPNDVRRSAIHLNPLKFPKHDAPSGLRRGIHRPLRKPALRQLDPFRRPAWTEEEPLSKRAARIFSAMPSALTIATLLRYFR